MTPKRVGIVGGGIVGLAVAREFQLRGATSVTVWEKEDRVGAHQTGHNSGVIHAGVYYQPGSLKARLCVKGAALMKMFCAEQSIPVYEYGKLVVASSVEERTTLMGVLERARRNGVPAVRWLEGPEIASVEPHISGVAAVYSPYTAVVDFSRVAEAIARQVRGVGGEVRLSEEVKAISEHQGQVTISSDGASGTYDAVVVCAGLGTDKVAALAGCKGDVRIVPFRGEYYELKPRIAEQVKGLVYPVPVEGLPFLGIHLTRTHDDKVVAGPNAVLALALEGYHRRDIDPREITRMLGWRGSRRFFMHHARLGARELESSLWRPAYAARARRYLPALRTSDLVRTGAGVRAQAMDKKGNLIDDFVIDSRGSLTLVRNAPSPAATSSLAIAREIVDRVLQDG